MLYVIAGFNFAMAILWADSGFAWLNHIVGWIVLAMAVHTTCVEIGRIFKRDKLLD